MSIKCQTRVWEFSRAKGSALLLLLAIAEHAHDDGTGAWPSQARLAKRTRMSIRQVRRLIDGLAKSGELSVTHRPGTSDMLEVLIQDADNLSEVLDEEGGQNVRPTPDMGVRPTPDISVPTPDIAVSGEPYLEPSSYPSGEPCSSEEAARAAQQPRRTNEEDAGVRRGRQKIAERLVGGVTGPFRTKRAVLLPQIDALLAKGWSEGWVENTLRLGSVSGWDAYRFAESFTDMNGADPICDEVAI